MSGFVGSRAKRRKRRYIYFFIIIFIICIFVFFNPNIKLILDPPIPEENIIPEKNEEIFSDMSKIEDLKLKVFQSEQKLNFRNIENISLAVFLSKLPVGSSAKIISGLLIKALDIAIL